MKKLFYLVVFTCFILLPAWAVAAPAGLPAVTVTTGPQGTSYSVTLQILILMTLLSFLPAIVIMMTPFARILIVLALLRQGLGTQQTPSNQILIGLALFMSFFIMTPVLDQVMDVAVTPYLEEKITLSEALQQARKPVSEFLLAQTREQDLKLFAEMAGDGAYPDQDAVPFSVLVPAYVTSELKTAFQIGFLLLIPFLVIDLVVASVLMSMGMMMLSPLIISLPFKIMLFVLVDGWTLVIGSLASSFFI